MAFNGSPVSAGSVAIDSTGTLLFAKNQFTGKINAFRVSVSGLTPVATNGTAPAGKGVLAIDPVHSFLYSPDSFTQNIYGFAFVPSGMPSAGSLTAVPGSPVAGGAACDYATIDPTRQQLFVSCRNTWTLYQLDIDTTSGALTNATGSPFGIEYILGPTAQFGNEGVLIDPSSKFFFLADDEGAHPGNVLGYPLPINGTFPAALPGSPTGTGMSTQSLTMPSAGGFLYAAGYLPANPSFTSYVAAFKLAANGSLTALTGSPYTLPISALQVMLEDTAGAWIALGATVQGSIAGPFWMVPVKADGTPGTQVVSPVTTNDWFGGIAFDPPFGLVFAADHGTVHALAFDYATGALTEMPGSPYTLQ